MNGEMDGWFIYWFIIIFIIISIIIIITFSPLLHLVDDYGSPSCFCVALRSIRLTARGCVILNSCGS